MNVSGCQPTGDWKARGTLEAVIINVRIISPWFVSNGIRLQTVTTAPLPSDIFDAADTVNSIDLYEWTTHLQAIKTVFRVSMDAALACTSN
jgi:hypothetical protein